jgi:hypothetical protein
MAQIDPSIAMGFRPVQIESPVNQMAAISQLENARNQNALAQYQLGAAKRAETKETNRINLLAKAGTNEQAVASALLESGDIAGYSAYVKAMEDRKTQKLTQDKTTNDIVTTRLSQFKDLLNTINPDAPDAGAQYLAWHEANHKDPYIGPLLASRGVTADQSRATINVAIAQGPKAIAEMINKSRLGIDKFKENEQKQSDRTAPKPEKFELGGKIVTRDMNPNSNTYLQTISTDEKTAAPAAIVESPLAKLVRERETLAKDTPNSPMLKVYDEAIGKETGGAPPALVQEYLYAQKNDGYKGTLLQFKEQVARAGRNVTNNPAPVQTVTVQGPNGPEMRDARTGRRITDDQGKPLVPYDASTKPLTPVQQQKLRKDQVADNGKIVAAKDMADDVQKNVDALLGNPDKKIPRHPGYSGITGYNALIPSFPGGNARAAQQLLDNIKGKVTVLGKNLASQEGKLGNMAVQEWKIVADALERIDPAAPNFPDQLRSIATQARRLETNLKTRNAELYPAAPSSSGGGGILDEADAVLKGR